MFTYIPNFCRSHSLRLTVQPIDATVGTTVCISSMEGPMTFVHHMTPDQARQMAAALLAAAETIQPATTTEG